MKALLASIITPFGSILRKWFLDENEWRIISRDRDDALWTQDGIVRH